MSLLAGCAQGSILGAVENAIRTDLPPSTELRDRILEEALPTQREFLLDNKSRILGLVAGFGSGKTHALCNKVILLALDNIGTVGLVAEPTYPMIRDVFCRSFDDVLEHWGIDYDFRVSPQPEYELHFAEGSVTILCRSLLNWDRIRGQNLSFCLADEIDTAPVETAQKASEMMLARMRSGKVNQLAVATTPEGYRWAYRTFIERAGEGKRLIKARTADNPYLPPDFIPSLKANYPPQLIAAYLNGEFTNLASCSVFPDYDRSLHSTSVIPDGRDTIYIGIDLNVGNCVTEHLVRRGDELHFFGEAVYRDTQQIAEGLAELYPQHFAAGQLVLIPDAASKQRSTAASQASDLTILKDAGHVVKVQQSNPLIQDRINTANVLISQNNLFVSNDCRHLRRSLEQLAYDDRGRPEKGAIGMEDLSHAADAATYATYRLRPLRPYRIGPGRSRSAQLW